MCIRDRAEMTRRYPDKELIPILPDQTCEYMKMITLEGCLLYTSIDLPLHRPATDSRLLVHQVNGQTT